MLGNGNGRHRAPGKAVRELICTASPPPVITARIDSN